MARVVIDDAATAMTTLTPSEAAILTTANVTHRAHMACLSTRYTSAPKNQVKREVECYFDCYIIDTSVDTVRCQKQNVHSLSRADNTLDTTINCASSPIMAQC